MASAFSISKNDKLQMLLSLHVMKLAFKFFIDLVVPSVIKVNLKNELYHG
jgi:hypothetical protein